MAAPETREAAPGQDPRPVGNRAPLGGRTAWAVFAAGTTAYGIAVLERTSLGVAGMAAADHFGASAGVVATFVVVQLLTYTAMQIPVGVLLDRFGSRRLIISGMAIMTIGQLLIALADSLSLALPARVILGAGDAFIFASVVRLLPAWFPAARVPVLTQVFALLGQLGQIASAVPFALLLEARGWSTAFVTIGALAGVGAALATLVLRDSPAGRVTQPSGRGLWEIPRTIAAVSRHPGTRLGMWTHWSSGFAPMVFALMWGFPYLTQGEGRSPRTASLLLTLLVVVGAICGPVIGVLTGRHPLRRSTLAVCVALASALPWLAVLAWPGPAPLALLIVLCAGLALGGPGSAIGFDHARTFTASRRLGTANSIVNMGGFTAALLTILLVGIVLDRVSPSGSDYTLGQFRLAMAVQLPVYAVGIGGIYLSRRGARRILARQGTVVPSWREALRREWRTRTRAPR